MERRPRKVLDPMIAPQVARRQVASYTPRPAQYNPYARITDVRPPHAQQSTPKVPAPEATVKNNPVHAATPKSVHTTPQKKTKLKLPSRQNWLLYGMAVFVFAIGLMVSLNGLHTNHQVEAQVKHSQKQTTAAVSNSVVPSTDKPSSSVVQNYAVAPNIPKYLDIEKLGIHTRILSEGIAKDGQLQVPWNIYDTGWYNASSQPGQMGAMLIDGHSGIGKTHGVFYQLNSLAAGDRISVTRGDNKVFSYTVTSPACMLPGFYTLPPQ